MSDNIGITLSKESLESLAKKVDKIAEESEDRARAFSHLSRLLSDSDMNAIVSYIGSRRLAGGTTLLMGNSDLSKAILPAVVKHILPDAINLKFVRGVKYGAFDDWSCVEFNIFGFDAKMNVKNEIRVVNDSGSPFVSSRHTFGYGRVERSVALAKALIEDKPFLDKIERAWVTLKDKGIINENHEFCGTTAEDARVFMEVSQPDYTDKRSSGLVEACRFLYYPITARATLSMVTMDQYKKAQFISQHFNMIKALSDTAASVESSIKKIQQWHCACKRIKDCLPEGFDLACFGDEGCKGGIDDLIFDDKTGPVYAEMYDLLDTAQKYRFAREAAGFSPVTPMFPDIVKRYSRRK